MKKITLLFFAVLMSALSWQGMAQSGSTCDDPLVVTSMPFNDSGNTSTYGNNYGLSDVPALAPDAITNGTASYGYYITGDDVVYSYTPAIDGSITINTTNDDDWIGLLVFTGCPFESTVGYHTSTSGATRSIPDLPVMVGETYYIVISTWASPQSTDYTISITGTDVGDPPTCLKPSDLVVSNITTTSADLGWTEVNTATSWNLEYGEAGFEQGSGTLQEGLTSNSYSVTDLTQNTVYAFYVQSDCGAGDESAWAGPYNFRTDCSTASLPYVMNFDDATIPNLPSCTSQENLGSGNNWTTQVYNSNGMSGSVLKYQYSSSAAANVWFYTQGIELEVGVSYQISYKYFGSSTWPESMKVAYGTTAEATAMINQLEDHPSIGDAGDELVYFEVNASGIYYFGFHAYSSANQNGLYLDDIEIKEAPSCIAPSDLELSNITATSVDLNWIENATATAWEIEYGPVGFEEGAGTVVSADSNPYTLNIPMDQEYHFYVRSSCDIEDASEWVGPAFYGYCEVSTTYAEYLTQVSSSGAITNISYSATAQPEGSYANETARTFEAYETQEFEIHTTYSSGSNGVNVWVDWDQNMEFDEVGELMAYEVGADASKTLSITVPAGTPEGEYRMRVRGQWGSSANPPACGNVNYGSTVDFTLTVVPLPTCFAPTDLTASNITATSAVLGWTEVNAATSWNIEFGEAGFERGSGTMEEGLTSNPFSLTGLTQNTAYEFYVQSDCGNEDISAWGGPYTFTTSCGMFASVPYVLDFDSATIPNLPACTSHENLGIGNDWKTKAAPAGFNGNVLNYSYHSSSNPGPANSWFYTQGVELEAGVDYEISYKYGNNSTTWAESMKVAYGTSADEAAMTNQLADYPEIELSNPADELITFTVNADGVYYFGFNAYSIENQNQLYLDDIEIKEVPAPCDAVTDVVVSNIAATTATVNWTASATAVDGYIVNVFEEGADTSTATAIFNDTVAVGGTTSEVTGLTPETGYDVYVTSDCGEVSITSDVVSFTTVIEVVGGSCDWTVIVQENYFGDEVDWELRDDDGDILLSGGGYLDSSYYDEQTISAEGPLEFFITSDGGFGDNTPTYSVFNGTVILVSGTLSGGDTVTYSDLNCGAAPIVCDAVTDVVVSDIAGTTATVNWTASATATQGYVVNVYEAGTTTTTVFTDTVAVGGTTSEITGLSPETNYDVYVVANCDSGDTATSAVVTFTTEAALPCEAVTDIIVSDITPTVATVSWTASAAAVDGYIVEVYEAGSEIVSFSDAVAAGVTTIELTELTPYTAYDVYVISNCGSGETATSDMVTFTTEPTTSVEDLDLIKLTVYPNPVSTDLNISAAKVMEEIQVYNILGQRVMTHKSNNSEVTLDVTGLPSATYMLEVSVDGVVRILKFVKK